ncbi:MAG: universal stress protein [Desulfonatronovibrionaceae bacterium]
MLNNFLFPVDSKVSTQAILGQAELIKSFEPEKVFLLYVAPGETKRINRKLDAIEEGMHKLDLAVERQIRIGHVPSQIVAAAEISQSVICFVKKRMNPLRKALAGSVLSDVVRMSDQPVLIYRKGLFSLAGQKLRSSMYATDFMYSDYKCLQYIKHPAFKAKRLILLHVGQRAPDPETEKKRLDNVYKNLERLAEECRDNFEEIEKREVLGLGVVHKILSHARKSTVDLLVVGKLDAPGIVSHLTGSTAEAIYNRASCSVLIIPNSK